MTLGKLELIKFIEASYQWFELTCANSVKDFPNVILNLMSVNAIWT